MKFGWAARSAGPPVGGPGNLDYRRGFRAKTASVAQVQRTRFVGGREVAEYVDVCQAFCYGEVALEKRRPSSNRNQKSKANRKTSGQGTIDARIQRLEEHARLLEYERDLIRTLYQYAHCLDYGLEGGFADCWLDTAVWERYARGKSTMLCDGLPQILAAFRQHTHAPELYHKHVVIEPLITFHGADAEVTSYFFRIDEHPTGPYIRGFGRYDDVLVRCEDGRWRFRQRRILNEQHFLKPAVDQL
jgi:hypothetical protein